MHDDREEFLLARQKRLSELSPTHPARKEAQEFFSATLPILYSYNFDWLGVPIIQYPQDILALQDLIWRVKPEVIIETGVARGGSVIFYASMLKLLDNGGTVVGVDIDIRPHNRSTIELHPLGKGIVLIEGSSIDEAVVAQVAKHVAPGRRALVVLDSMHSKAHVAKELELYSRFVGSGSYIAVLDTCIEFTSAEQIGNRPWAKGNSPLNAVHEFVAASPRFVIDETLDAKLLVSVAPNGYLKCIADL